MYNSRSVLTRYSGNPIIAPETMPFDCYTVMNAGATWYNDRVVLLLRVENCARETNFYVAKSDDGLHFTVESEPLDYPRGETERLLNQGNRFDMRVTYIEGRYIIMHACYVSMGCTLAICETTDFKSCRSLTRLSEPSNRNGVLFPEKIGGLYARLDRPQDVGHSNSRMWISFSPDLEFWGRSLPLMFDIPEWAYIKSGASCVPIKTDKGWIVIYHGVAATCSSNNYSLGAVLLDLNDPSKVIAAPKSFLLTAEKDYECMGQTPNVVFAGGGVLMPDGTYNLYYGGADTRMCLAQTTVEKLLDFCLHAY